MLGREPPRSLTFGGRVPVARSERIHDFYANRRSRHPLDACPFE